MFQGTHDELMKNNPEYRMMIMAEEQRIANEPPLTPPLSSDEHTEIEALLVRDIERLEEQLRKVYNELDGIKHSLSERKPSKRKYNDYIQ